MSNEATVTECPTCGWPPCYETKAVGQDDKRWQLKCADCGTIYWYPKLVTGTQTGGA